MSLYFRTFLLVLSASLLLVACDNSEPEPEPTPTGPQILDCAFFDTNDRIVLSDQGLAVDYIIECTETRIGTDLVIEPGVTIECSANVGIDILDAGSFSAQGTADDPIVITAVDKVPGAWKGVQIQSNNVNNRLSYVTISYGGGEAFNSNDEKGNLIIWPLAQVSVDRSTFSNGVSYGVNIVDEATITAFTNNSMTGNLVPAKAFSSETYHFDASSSYTGNTNDHIEVLCDAVKEGDYTWRKLDVPYRVVASSFGLVDVITIPGNSNITVEAGATMSFTSNTGIKIEEGSFKAIGTSDEVITFTGEDALAGAWKGIEYRFSQSVNNVLDYIAVQYAGSGEDDAAIYMWAEPRLTVSNSTFTDIDGCVFRTPADPFENENFSSSNITAERVSGGIECP